MRRALVATFMAVVVLASVRARATFSWAPARLTSAAGWQAPAPQSTFRGGVDLVQVDVSVLDKDRKPVRGLTASDFTLLEDGKPRPVVAFTAVDLPGRPGDIVAPWTREVASDVATNTLPEDGRLVIILMDRSIPDGDATVRAKAIAKVAIDELGEGDLAAVVYSGSAGTPQDFTNDKARLRAAIDRNNPAGELSDGANAVFDDLMASAQQPGYWLSTALPALSFSTDCMCGACVLEQIGKLADAIRDVGRRRKSLLFIGSNLQIETVTTTCIDAVTKARRAMFSSLDLASLTVHTLDPIGLEAPAMARASARASAGPDGMARLVRQGNIAVLPDRTGGRTVINTNDPGSRVAEIFAESGSYYLLGFEPSAADGRRHDINVKVNRRGLDVRTRHAYVANAVATSSPTAAPVSMRPAAAHMSAAEAVKSLMPRRDGVALSASVLAVEAPKTHEPVLAVALHVQHDASAADAPAASGSEQVEIETAVFTTTGLAVGTLRQTLAVTPQRSASGAATYDVLQRIPAKPGRYELRIGLHNATRQQTGSVYAFVDVPSFVTAPFSLSEVGVFAPEGAPAMKQTLADVLPAPPTARRDFDRRERATAFMRVHQGVGSLLATVWITTRIVDDTNHRKFEQESSIPAAEFSGGRTGDYAVDLPLASLDPGSYLLTIETKAGLSVAHRDVRFSVR